MPCGPWAGVASAIGSPLSRLTLRWPLTGETVTADGTNPGITPQNSRSLQRPGTHPRQWSSPARSPLPPIRGGWAVDLGSAQTVTRVRVWEPVNEDSLEPTIRGGSAVVG